MGQSRISFTCRKMAHTLYLLLLVTLLESSSSTYWSPSHSLSSLSYWSSCNYDYDCPSLVTRNTGCSGLFCWGAKQTFQRDLGRCVARYGSLCKVRGWLTGLNYRQRLHNCLYRECAECLDHSHCPSYRDSCDLRSHRCYERRTYVGVHATKAGLDASLSLLHFANAWVKQPGKKKTQTVYSNQKKISDKKKGDTLVKKKLNKKNGGTSGDQTTEGYNPETSWMYG